MLAVRLLALSTLYILTNVTIALVQQDGVDGGDVRLPIPTVAALAASSASSSPSPILKVRCDGDFYGRNLNVASCRDVFRYMPKNDTQLVFADRNSGVPHDIPIPWRTMSSDGRCFAQPLLAKDATSGHASATQLGGAAYTLFHHCVIEKGIGGIAANLGGDEQLHIALADFNPNVRCDKGPTPGPPFESCFNIFADVETTKDRRVFGNRGEPRVEVDLPLTLTAIDARCTVQIGITGKPTSLSWYEVWEAIMAVFAMCVRRHGKGGKAYQLGLRRNVYLVLEDENPDVIFDTIRANTTSSYDSFEASAASNFSDMENAGSMSAIPFEISPALDGGWDTLVELPDITPSNSSISDQSR